MLRPEPRIHSNFFNPFRKATQIGQINSNSKALDALIESGSFFIKDQLGKSNRLPIERHCVLLNGVDELIGAGPSSNISLQEIEIDFVLPSQNSGVLFSGVKNAERQGVEVIIDTDNRLLVRYIEDFGAGDYVQAKNNLVLQANEYYQVKITAGDPTQNNFFNTLTIDINGNSSVNYSQNSQLSIQPGYGSIHLGADAIDEDNFLNVYFFRIKIIASLINEFFFEQTAGRAIFEDNFGIGRLLIESSDVSSTRVILPENIKVPTTFYNEKGYSTFNYRYEGLKLRRILQSENSISGVSFFEESDSTRISVVGVSSGVIRINLTPFFELPIFDINAEVEITNITGDLTSKNINLILERESGFEINFGFNITTADVYSVSRNEWSSGDRSKIVLEIDTGDASTTGNINISFSSIFSNQLLPAVYSQSYPSFSLFSGASGNTVKINNSFGFEPDGVDDYIDSGLVQTLNSDFTVVFWGRRSLDVLQNNNYYITTSDNLIPAPTNGFSAICRYINDNVSVGFNLDNSQGSSVSILAFFEETDQVIPLGGWFHCCLTYNNTSKEFRLFINGKFEQLEIEQYAYPTTGTLSIFGNSTDTNFYNSKFAYLLYSERILTDREIKNNYLKTFETREIDKINSDSATKINYILDKDSTSIENLCNPVTNDGTINGSISFTQQDDFLPISLLKNLNYPNVSLLTRIQPSVSGNKLTTPFNITNDNQPFTLHISFVYRNENQATNRIILSQSDFELNIDASDNLKVTFTTGSTQLTSNITTIDATSIGERFNVTIVFTPSNYKVYLDGNLEVDENISSVDPVVFSPSNNITLCGTSGNSADTCDIDLVSLFYYNQAISNSLIQNIQDIDYYQKAPYPDSLNNHLTNTLNNLDGDSLLDNLTNEEYTYDGVLKLVIGNNELDFKQGKNTVLTTSDSKVISAFNGNEIAIGEDIEIIKDYLGK